MADKQAQVPGGPFVNETSDNEQQIPGGPFLNQTSPASGPSFKVYWAANSTQVVGA